MKRKMRIKARQPLARKAWMKRAKKAMPKVNKASQKRKLAKYNAFISSPTWRAIRLGALERAGHQCEHVIESERCPMRTTLTVHHVRYLRFGGEEIPGDLQVLCKAHHEAVHAARGNKMLWQRVG